MLNPNVESIVEMFNRSKQVLFNRWALFCLISIYCVIQTLFIGSKFGTNDDVGMSQIANGGFTGAPSEHLIFINTVLGFTLKFLYTIIPTIQWYSVLMVCSLVFSLSVFLDALMRQLKPRGAITKVIFLAATSAIIFPTFLNSVFEVNYSGTAYFCSILGFCSWLLCLKDSNYRVPIAPLFACLLGFLWRDSAFYSVLPIWIVVIFVLYRRGHKRKYLNSFAFIGLMLAFGRITDYFSKHSSQDWKAFHELNSLRGLIHGNKIIDSVVMNQGMKQLSESSGISRINLDFFFGWFVSYNAMGKSSLQKLVEIISDNSMISIFQLGEVAIAEAEKSLKMYLAIWLVFLVFNASFKWKFLFSSAIVIGLQLLIISYLEIYIRTPKYVIDGIQFSVTMAALLLLFSQLESLEDSYNSQKQFWFMVLIPFFLVLALGLSEKMNYISNNVVIAKKVQGVFEQDLAGFENILSEPAVAFSAPFELANVNPWSPFRMTEIPLITLGWGMSSPLQENRLAYFGADTDLDRALLKGGVSVLSLTGSDTPFQVQRYLTSNFGECLEVSTSSVVGTTFSLSRFSPSPNCDNRVISSPPLSAELFLTDPSFSASITNCLGEIEERSVQFDFHSPFGVYAKPFRIEIEFIGLNSAPTKLLYTIEPGRTNQLTVITAGCEIDIHAISSGVVPSSIDKKSTDSRTLYFGVSRVAIIPE